MSIRLKILIGCFCLTALTMLVGALAQSSQREIGDLATRLYDNSLVSMNALRSAQASVVKLAAEVGDAAGSRASEPLDEAAAERIAATLMATESDLVVASSGSISGSGRNIVDQTRRRLGALALSGPALTYRHLNRELRLAEDEINAAVRVFSADAFDVKGEVNSTMHMSVAKTRAAIGIAGGLMVLVAWLLIRTVVPSLKRAAEVARSIADGNLTNTIGRTGGDEAGQLLGALATMQTTLAERLDHFETAVARQATAFDAERSVHGGRLRDALESMVQGLCMFDRAGKVGVHNQRFLEIFGSPAIQSGDAAARLAKIPELGAVLAAAKTAKSFIHETADGRILSVAKHRTAESGFVLTIDDVTENRAAEARLDHAATHDGMTGLRNRLTLVRRLQALFSEPERARRTALLVIDIEGFRGVNEAYGHETGDALLKQVAESLSSFAKENDLVARIDGDDFAFVRNGFESPAEVEELAAAILGLFRQPFLIGSRSVPVGASIGIAPARERGPELDDVEALLLKADLALQAARQAGRNRFRFFEPSMEAAAQQRRQTEMDLGRALAEGQFEIFYQPFVDVPLHSIAGFEALLRWRHPTRGMISPAEFIPIAEATGAIVPIGLWVLETACRHAADWPTGLTVSVNLSPMQFESETLFDDISDILKRTEFQPYRLQLEVTEGVFLHNTEAVMTTLSALRKLGVRISMDDFGTGYSSLGYLSRFPFDKVKIDQSFVRDLAKRENLMIVRAIVGLSKAMGISVMAEGVETRRQMETLVAESCFEMQGYHFARPMPLSDLPRFMMQFSLDRLGQGDPKSWVEAGRAESA